MPANYITQDDFDRIFHGEGVRHAHVDKARPDHIIVNGVDYVNVRDGKCVGLIEEDDVYYPNANLENWEPPTIEVKVDMSGISWEPQHPKDVARELLIHLGFKPTDIGY